MPKCNVKSLKKALVRVPGWELISPNFLVFFRWWTDHNNFSCFLASSGRCNPSPSSLSSLFKNGKERRAGERHKTAPQSRKKNDNKKISGLKILNGQILVGYSTGPRIQQKAFFCFYGFQRRGLFKNNMSTPTLKKKERRPFFRGFARPKEMFDQKNTFWALSPPKDGLWPGNKWAPTKRASHARHQAKIHNKTRFFVFIVSNEEGTQKTIWVPPLSKNNERRRFFSWIFPPQRNVWPTKTRFELSPAKEGLWEGKKDFLLSDSHKMSSSYLQPE